MQRRCENAKWCLLTLCVCCWHRWCHNSTLHFSRRTFPHFSSADSFHGVRYEQTFEKMSVQKAKWMKSNKKRNLHLRSEHKQNEKCFHLEINQLSCDCVRQEHEKTHLSSMESLKWIHFFSSYSLLLAVDRRHQMKLIETLNSAMRFVVGDKNEHGACDIWFIWCIMHYAQRTKGEFSLWFSVHLCQLHTAHALLRSRAQTFITHL